MAKKKVKKEKKTNTLNENGTVKMPEMGGSRNMSQDEGLERKIKKLNRRIDKIVNAHERCRSLKGL